MFRRWMMFGPLMDADTGATGGEAAPTPEATPTPTPAPPMQNPLLTQGIYREEGALPSATPAPEPVVPKLNFGGREVPVIDPVIEDVYKDYTELTRTFTQTNQQMKQLEAQNAQLQQMMQFAMQQQQQAQPVTPQPSGPSPEEVEAQKEAFMEKFYDDPMRAIQDMAMQLIQKEVQPVIEPIQEERNFHAEARRLQQLYPDFGDMVPTMQQLAQQMPELEQLGMEKVYLLAKNMGVPSTPAQPTPAVAPTPQPTATPEDVRQQLMTDPDVRQQIFNDMLREKQQQQAAVPPVMGNQSGGAIPTIPENRPKSIREGSRALMRHLGIPMD